MKLADKPLRHAYWNLLQGLVYKGNALPIYGENIPDSAPNFYIALVNQTSTEEFLKCTFSTENHIMVNVVTKYKSGFGNEDDSQDIADLVARRVLIAPGKTGIDLSPDFKIFKSKLVMNKGLRDDTGTQNIMHRYVAFSHTIKQL